MTFRISALFISFVLFMPLLALAQMHKWVDEQGRVHYGDRVPEKYLQKAESVEENKISVVGPEDDVRRENRAHVSKLRRESAREEARLQREQNVKKRSTSPKSSTKSRSWCRDVYPNNVKLRTECLRQASSNED